jgi:hypothetical protein
MAGHDQLSAQRPTDETGRAGHEDAHPRSIPADASGTDDGMADIIDLIYEDHDWLRRHFFYLDDASTAEELTAIWEPLADRLDLHADAEETVFYPVLLQRGEAGDPRDETEDAIEDHNAIRDAVRSAREHPVGSHEWFEAVGKARTENGEHLDEEEREALPDFIVEPVDKDPDGYLEQNT